MTASSPERGRLLKHAVPIAIALALVVAIGCASKPVNNPPDNLIGKPWANVGETMPPRDGDTDAVASLASVFAGKPPPTVPGRPLNVLCMSGGGKYGAFTAGVLAGWTASGQRPIFDIATGISSGGVVATLAFLGPKYDRKLASYFTDLSRADLYKWTPIRGLIEGTGLLSAEPLERLLAREISDEFLSDLRAAHAEGRRLYVGTGNVTTNRPVVWDLGGIASSGREDAPVLIRKILLASCAPPGAIRPIEIDVEVNGVRYKELHSDAGNFSQVFMRSPAGIPAGSTVWVLSAGKIYRDPMREKPKLMTMISGGVSNSLYALFRSDLMKLFALCAVDKLQYRLLSLPEDFRGTASSFSFESEELSRLYWIGYQMTVSNGGDWRTTPPDTLPGEATPPRIGTHFTYP
jgi:Patatin-like phospholipase